MYPDYYRSSAFAPNIYHTIGVQLLAEQARCYWLIDAIVSYQLSIKIRREPFQVWTLKVENRQGVLTCGDGNDTPPLVTQKIPYTDLPMEEVTLYLEDGSVDGVQLDKILMLPSER
jgi:hypothetical protein